MEQNNRQIDDGDQADSFPGSEVIEPARQMEHMRANRKRKSQP